MHHLQVTSGVECTLVLQAHLKGVSVDGPLNKGAIDGVRVGVGGQLCRDRIACDGLWRARGRLVLDVRGRVVAVAHHQRVPSIPQDVPRLHIQADIAGTAWRRSHCFERASAGLMQPQAARVRWFHDRSKPPQHVQHSKETPGLRSFCSKPNMPPMCVLKHLECSSLKEHLCTGPAVVLC